MNVPHETMTIGAQLRAAYAASPLTLADVAHAAGVSESTVLNIFRGRNVTAGNLFAVAGALGVRSVAVPVPGEPSSPSPALPCPALP